MRRIMLLTALVLWFSSALAADRPEVVQAGFSPDARYHLLLTSFYGDGSGFPNAALQITDVKRNAIVYRRTPTWQTDQDQATPLGTLVATWKKTQAAVLARYGLSRPLTGQRLFMTAPLPVLAYPADRPAYRATYRATSLGILTLTPVPLRSTCTYNQAPTRGFVLRLNQRVLQRDVRLPDSRQCASGYSLDTAWAYKKNLVVILRSYARAFEGPDVMPLVVAASLKP